MNKLTPEQINASNPELSVVVCANAGTGKTALLTARVLRLLVRGNKPSKILCLTYTKSAAAEMRERIFEGLMEWHIASDEQIKQSLENLGEDSIGKAEIKNARGLFLQVLESEPPPKIMTIHAFAQEVLQRFSVEAGVEANFRVVENNQELLEKAKSNLINFSLEDADSDLIDQNSKDIIDRVLGDISEYRFDNLVKQLVGKKQFLAQQLGEAKLSYDDILIKLRDQFEVYESMEQIAEEAINKLPTMWLASFKDEELAPICNYGNETRIIALKKALVTKSNKSKVEIYKEVEFCLSGKKKDALLKESSFFKKPYTNKNPDILASLRHMLDVISAAQQKIFDIETLDINAQAWALGQVLYSMYDALKLKDGVLDFDDLIQKTRDLFCKSDAASWVLYKLDGGIDHILIDEAQDTNPTQWEIVNNIISEFTSGAGREAEFKRTVFAVGDTKQSIYSFQGANPNLLLEFESKNTLESKQLGEDSNLAKFISVPLKTSFRSVEVVLNNVDKLFAKERLNKAVTLHGAAVEHSVFRKQEAGKLAILPLFTKPKDEEKEGTKTSSKSKAKEDQSYAWDFPFTESEKEDYALEEATYLVDMIKNWLKTGRILANHNRPVKPEDILILFQNRKCKTMHHLRRLLTASDIPVSGSDKLKLYDSIAIKDILSFAKFILLPDDDYNLACLLKSPFFNFTDADLINMRSPVSGSNKKTYWHALEAYKPKAYQYLSIFLGKAAFKNLYTLFSTIIQLGGRDKLVSRLGAESNEVLDEFLFEVKNYEQSDTPSLEGFICHMEKSDNEIKRDMELGGNMIRIMTVHNAKGLQAPIVLLPDANKGLSPNKDTVMLKDDGSMFCFTSKEKLSAKYQGLIADRNEKSFDEYMRLLYVATTRAEDELYISGNGKSVKANSWFDVLSNCFGQGFSEATHRTTTKPIKAGKASLAAANKALPKHMAKQQIDIEKAFSTKIIPSKEDINDEAKEAAAIGSLVHDLLHKLAGKAPEQIRQKLALIDTSKQASPSQQQLDNIFTILTDEKYQHYFVSTSYPELEIIATKGQETQERYIDRLVINQQEVIILDYKTGQPTDDKSQKYKQQLLDYKELVANLYPDKNITCQILWVDNLQIEEVSGK